MADKVTTEIFIERSKNKYHNRFDYSDTVYVSSKKRLTITCVEHGSFDILPTNHMHGMGGCRQCMSESFKARRGYTVSEIIDRFISIHGDRYDYSLVNKSGSFDIVTIGCRVHGWFQQEVRVHLMGCGCAKCFADKHGKEEQSSNEYFLKRTNDVHGDTYDYSNAIYNGVRSKIIIGCSIHGNFEQIANNHLRGSGCPKCAEALSAFKKKDWIEKSKNKIGTFYIIRCYNEYESFYKYGITYKGVNSRYNGIKSMPYKYEIVRLVMSTDKDYIWDLENRFGKFKEDDRYNPLIKFAGCANECFATYTKIDRTR